MVEKSGKTRKKSLRYYRTLCDRSFYHFVLIVGGAVHQGGVANPHIHGRFCKFTQDATFNKRNAIATPRDWLKSTIFTKWKAIWDYLQDQEERQLIAAENERLSSLMLKWIGKQCSSNDLLRQLYPDKLSYFHKEDQEWRLIDGFYRRTHTWSGKALELPRKGHWAEPAITAIGIKGAAQGGHYTTIHIDDLVGEAAMESELVMEDVLRWFDNVNELLVNPDWESPEGSKVCVVGTHWGPGDFFCYVQDKYPEYRWRIAPCRKDSSLIDTDTVKWIQHPDQDEGETNWPGSPFTTKYYVQMLNNPEKVDIYWNQHMNNPSRAGGSNKFEKSWLKFYRWEDRESGLWVVCENDDGTDGEAFRVCDTPLYGFIDPGGFAVGKRMTKGSRNAILVGGQPKDSIKKFIFHAEAFKFKRPSDFLDRIFQAHDKWKPRAWRIDTVGTQPYIYHHILEARKERGSSLPISPIDSNMKKDSKDSDIETLIGPVSNGEWYVHRSMQDLIAEMVSFPVGMTRDILDMWGKLNVSYIQRGKRADSERINLNRQRFRTSQRDKTTGY